MNIYYVHSKQKNCYGADLSTHMDRLEETSPMIYTATISTDW